MEAVVYDSYGSPDVLRLEEVAEPAPGDDEMLVEVHAASVNAADWHLLRGTPFFMRSSMGFPKPRHKILGSDVAGRVVAVGRKVGQFQPGDEVYGDLSESGLGGFAEYVCVPQNAALALKPANMTFEEAAAVPLAAVTALQGLRDKGQIQSGQKVLVNGASGGVGTFAVQIAKAFGAETTAVCSTSKVDTARSLGADHVIDYTQADFTRIGQQYDLIADIVGNRSVSDYARALDPRGSCVIIGYTSPALLFQHMFRGAWVSRTGSKKIGLMGSAQPNKHDLVEMKELVEAGKVVSVIDRRYPLSEVAEALRYLEEGHARGKVVITVKRDAVTRG